MGLLAHVVAVEELGRGAGTVGGILAAHGIAVDALVLSGDPTCLLAAAALGSAGVAPALQEDDSQLVTSEATATNGSWTVTGRKVQVPFRGLAKAYVVHAREEKSHSLFLVEVASLGVHHRDADARMNLHGLETGPLVLDHAPAIRLGGADLVARVLASARIAVSALLAGIGRDAVGAATRYSHERKQFDRNLHEFVAMQERLARGDARVEAARALCHGAARLRDRGEPCVLAASRALGGGGIRNGGGR